MAVSFCAPDSCSMPRTASTMETEDSTSGLKIEVANNNFRCFCRRNFSDGFLLTEHLRSCQKRNTGTAHCGLCRVSFLEVDDLHSHLSAHLHSGTIKTRRPSPRQSDAQATEGNKHECCFCGIKFQLKSSLKQHTDRVHHSGTQKQVYERKYTGRKPYKCAQVGCGRSFVGINELRKHTRAHSGERPYKCDKCSNTFTQLANLRRHQRQNCGMHLPLKKMLRKRSSPKGTRRPPATAPDPGPSITAVGQEAFDVPEPACISTLTGPIDLPAKSCSPPQLPSIQPSTTLTQINTYLEDFSNEPLVEDVLGHLAEDPTFNAFGDSRPALDLGLDGMDTRPIQLLGLDDMEPHFVNEALNLAYDDGHQSVGPLSLDSAFDLGFAPFKKSASLDALDIVHNDVLNGGIDEEDSNLLNCLQLEVPFLSQSGFNIPTRREAGPRANTARAGDETATTEPSSSSEVEGSAQDQSRVAPSPYKLKHRSGLLHLRSKPLQQRRHTMGINPVKKAVKLATTRKKRSPRGLVRPVKQREPIIDWDVDNDELMDMSKQQEVNGQDAYTCPYCDRTFTEPGHFRLHMVRTHQQKQNKKFSCRYCHKQYSDRNTLKGHENQHNGENKFSCRFCHKVFNIKAGLVIHERVHSGQRPFNCESCAKTFRSSNELTRHRRTHTGARPYKCAYCTMSFTQSANLTRHIQKSCKVKRGKVTVIDAPPVHSCSVCGASFTEQNKLEQHAATCRDTSTPESASSPSSHQAAELPVRNTSDVFSTAARARGREPKLSNTKYAAVKSKKKAARRVSKLVKKEGKEVGRKRTAKSVSASFQESIPEVATKTHDDFETSMKIKLEALNAAIKNQKTNQEQPTEARSEERIHPNGFREDPIKNFDFLSTDDSTIGYENDMPVCRTQSTSSTTDVATDTVVNSNNATATDEVLTVIPITVKPNGVLSGSPSAMETLSSLLTGNAIIPEHNGFKPDNGILPGTTIVPSNGFLPPNGFIMGENGMVSIPGVDLYPGSTNGLDAENDVLTTANGLASSANGLLDGTTFITTSEQKTGCYRTSSAVTVRRAVGGSHPLVAQWDSLRERSRKYKLARKIKNKCAPPVDLRDNIRIEGDGDEQAHICVKCDRRFKKLNHVKQHLIQHHKIHLGDKNYACNFCGKQYSDWITLKGHEKQHMGECFPCKHCNKPFYTRGTLKVHERTHSSERPYKCPECEKCFKTSRDMNRHTRKHTGIKPYKCVQCGKKFTQSGNLKRHMTNNKCVQQLRQTEMPPAPAEANKAALLKSRIKRKSYPPSKMRKVSRKRSRKQRKPSKKAPEVEQAARAAAEATAEGATDFPVASGAAIRTEPDNILPEIINVPTVAETGQEEPRAVEEMSENSAPEAVCTAATEAAQPAAPDVEPAVRPEAMMKETSNASSDDTTASGSVKPKSVNILRKILESADTIAKDANFFRRLETEVHASPMLSALNVEVRGRNPVSAHAHTHAQRPKHNFNVKFVTNDEGKQIQQALARDTDRKFTCTKCGTVVNSRTALTLHYNTKHINSAVFRQDGGSDSGMGVSDVPDVAALSCSFCSEAFRSPALVQEHELKLHLEQRCEDCGDVFEGKMALDQHVLVVHLGGRRYRCDACDKSYVFKGSLNKHLKTCKNLLFKRTLLCRSDSADATFQTLEDVIPVQLTPVTVVKPSPIPELHVAPVVTSEAIVHDPGVPEEATLTSAHGPVLSDRELSEQCDYGDSLEMLPSNTAQQQPPLASFSSAEESPRSPETTARVVRLLSPPSKLLTLKPLKLNSRATGAAEESNNNTNAAPTPKVAESVTVSRLTNPIKLTSPLRLPTELPPLGKKAHGPFIVTGDRLVNIAELDLATTVETPKSQGTSAVRTLDKLGIDTNKSYVLYKLNLDRSLLFSTDGQFDSDDEQDPREEEAGHEPGVPREEGAGQDPENPRQEEEGHAPGVPREEETTHGAGDPRAEGADSEPGKTAADGRSADNQATQEKAEAESSDTHAGANDASAAHQMQTETRGADDGPDPDPNNEGDTASFVRSGGDGNSEVHEEATPTNTVWTRPESSSPDNTGGATHAQNRSMTSVDRAIDAVAVESAFTGKPTETSECAFPQHAESTTVLQVSQQVSPMYSSAPIGDHTSGSKELVPNGEPGPLAHAMVTNLHGNAGFLPGKEEAAPTEHQPAPAFRSELSSVNYPQFLGAEGGMDIESHVSANNNNNNNTVKLTTPRGVLEVDRSALPFLGDCDQYMDILLRGDSMELKFQCKLCCRVFSGEGTHDMIGDRLQKHIEGHLQTKMRHAQTKGIPAHQVTPLFSAKQGDSPQHHPLPLTPSGGFQGDTAGAVAYATSPQQPMSIQHSDAASLQKSTDHVIPAPARSYSDFMNKIPGTNTVKCKLCHKTYSRTSWIAIKRHLQSVHKVLETGQLAPKSPESRKPRTPKAPVVQNMWQCKFCSAMFPPGSIRAMEEHLKNNHAQELDPSSPLLAKSPPAADATVPPTVASYPSASAVASVAPPTVQGVSSEQQWRNTSAQDLYTADMFKCRFCGQVFEHATVLDLQRHLLAKHGDIVDPDLKREMEAVSNVTAATAVETSNSGAATTSSRSSVVAAMAEMHSVPLSDQLSLTERVAAAVNQTIQEQTVPLPTGAGFDAPQAHISLSVGQKRAASGAIPPSVPAPPKLSRPNPPPVPPPMKIEDPSAGISQELHAALVHRLQEYEPFVQIVTDKFGPGFRCRLCGKTYSSSALSPIRRHLGQFHAGATYQGIPVPVKAEAKLPRPAASGRPGPDGEHAGILVPTAPGGAQVGSQMEHALLAENWADYSRFISLDLSSSNQILACKFCFKPYTVDTCKALIEHLQNEHLGKIAPDSQLHKDANETQLPQLCANKGTEQQPPLPEVATPSPQAHSTHSDVHSPASASDDDFIGRCSEIVTIGNAVMLKCKFCGVVYGDHKFDSFREHLHTHFRDPNQAFAGVSLQMQAPKQQDSEALEHANESRMVSAQSPVSGGRSAPATPGPSVVFTDDLMGRCSEVVPIGDEDMFKCKYCGVVYGEQKFDRFREHLFKHYRDSDQRLPEELGSPELYLRRMFAERLGECQGVNLSHCVTVVELDKVMVYQCGYCGDIFEEGHEDETRAHVYTHYVTKGGYPDNVTSADADPIPTASLSSDATQGPDLVTFPEPIEISPDT